jgi:hypothetical protein
MFRTLLMTTALAAVVSINSSCSDAEQVAAAQRPDSKPTAATTPAKSSAPGSTSPIPADRRRMVEEAVAAVRETQNALTAIDQNKADAALAALERATGKLEILLAREPSLALAPVDVGFVTYDVLGTEQAVTDLRKRAKEALERGRLQEARRLISELASETVMSVSNLPLATYPAAIKSAAALLHKGQTQQAKSALQAALNTLVIQEKIFPLPLIRAEAAIQQAKGLAEKPRRNDADNARLRALLAKARQEIRFGQALGYATEQDMGQLLAAVDEIEGKTTGQKYGKGFFDRIERLFDSVRGSSQLAQSPR